ncbi:carboxyl-terminal processing protease [Deinobacterium chartae]|uniref:Carboxyl-terminal processing protease n=1 Tax=Deinobacterium chartae TaxID=521158 RepID=A0A841HYR3_9DEIO|nr:S41 family peptidase [Deinobacterium chartae]MBB6098033.1 carboxyl-terminal processing protease [Deinobacterium chartae]
MPHRSILLSLRATARILVQPRLFLIGLLLVSPAQASPAHDLFNDVLARLRAAYGGPSAVTPDQLEARFRPVLEERCTPAPEECPLEVAEPVLRDLVEALGDPHTNFLASNQYGNVMKRFAGDRAERPSFGLTLRPLTDRAGSLILEVAGGGPAEEAGLRRGDIITAIDGVALDGDAAQRGSRLRERGESGQEVQLDVLRGSQRFTVRLAGRPLPLVSAPTLTLGENGLAVLRIPTFGGPGVAERVHQLVLEAQSKGASRMLLDLRGNGGGLLSQYVATAAVFAPGAGRIIEAKTNRTVYRFEDGAALTARNGGKAVAQFRIARPAVWDGKLAVLVNRSTGSAAEYLALDIQRAGRGQVVGEATYGVANTATSFFPLTGGAGLQVTLGHVDDLAGNALPERCHPDLEVRDDISDLQNGRDPVLEAALQTLD